MKSLTEIISHTENFLSLDKYIKESKKPSYLNGLVIEKENGVFLVRTRDDRRINTIISYEHFPELQNATEIEYDANSVSMLVFDDFSFNNCKFINVNKKEGRLCSISFKSCKLKDCFIEIADISAALTTGWDYGKSNKSEFNNCTFVGVNNRSDLMLRYDSKLGNCKYKNCVVDLNKAKHILFKTYKVSDIKKAISKDLYDNIANVIKQDEYDENFKITTRKDVNKLYEFLIKDYPGIKIENFVPKQVKIALYKSGYERMSIYVYS